MIRNYQIHKILFFKLHFLYFHKNICYDKYSCIKFNKLNYKNKYIKIFLKLY